MEMEWEKMEWESGLEVSEGTQCVHCADSVVVEVDYQVYYNVVALCAHVLRGAEWGAYLSGEARRFSILNSDR